MTTITRRMSSRLLSKLPAEDTPNLEPKRTTRTKRQAVRPPVIPSSSSGSEAEEKEEIVYKKPTVPVTPIKNKSRKAKESELKELSPVTPPKQKKLESNNENVLLKTPQTPSSLLKKLVLDSPPQVKSNRKKLFDGDGDVYQNAKKALHSSLPTSLPGREEELEELKEFVSEHLKLGTSGTLYVSGPPGTGKTASLNIILEEDDIASKLHKVYVNCTSIKSSTSIYSRIVKELGIKPTNSRITEKDSLVAIETYLKRNHKTVLLILDEIDQLESKNQSVLYTIFEWPSKPNSKLILIGIANALDLTDRILPRLQVRCELKPKLMHFAPYTKQQIVEIFTKRLKDAGVLTIFNPVALQMLAGKVAAVSGDVRRALDIGRRVIELVEQNRKEEILKSVENLIDGEVEKKTCDAQVDLKQVVNVLNNVYGTTQNLVNDEDDSFPLQQKIIICTLLLFLKKAKNKDVTIGKLHDVYRKVCSKRNLLGVDQSEFVGLCSLIETKGIIKVSGKKEARLHKVCLEWDEEEIVAVLKDKQLISSILENDASCLGKF